MAQLVELIAREGHIAVVGLGLTGCAAVRFLVQSGYSVGAFEVNPQAPGVAQVRAEFPKVSVRTGPLSEVDFQGFSQVLLSPGVPRSQPVLQRLIEQGIPVRGDVDWFGELVLRPVIAVTGSNGKTTVVSWLEHVLVAAGFDAALGGNIGVPVLDLLMQPERGLYILELSSFQLESTQSLRPTVACVLNVSPDHMDRYPDLASYAFAKQKIYRGASHVVFNREDDLTKGLLARDTRLTTFGLDAPEPGHFGVRHKSGVAYLAQGTTLLCLTSSLALPGTHNVANALAVLALAHAFGVPAEAAADALATFKGLPHRCQVAGTVAGVVCYNDSKATNVGATQAAIAGLSERHQVEGRPGLVVLLGGLGKGQDFSALSSAMQNNVAAVVVYGQAADQLAEALVDTVPVYREHTLRDAFEKARTLAEPQGAIVLSPACASQDQFRDYQDRGETFIGFVKQAQLERESGV